MNISIGERCCWLGIDLCLLRSLTERIICRSRLSHPEVAAEEAGLCLVEVLLLVIAVEHGRLVVRLVVRSQLLVLHIRFFHVITPFVRSRKENIY
jgi:hypothetical protein